MIIPVKMKDADYDIVLERGALKKVGEYINIKDNKVLIVTDSGVPEEYAQTVAASFGHSFIHIFPEGEGSKNFETYQGILQSLLTNGFNRKDSVIAVGGGVTGDMAGFAAATYMRGIDFYNIPTTLLSQVDSSIGGKTGIDFCSVKNIVGAFYQPKKVIIDPDVLSTLPDRQIANGLAESIKMGITGDKELFDIFKDKSYKEKTEEIIRRSLFVKRSVVEEDEKEAGLRRVLNFGHTLGHAIESAVGLGTLYHGECVGLGMLPMCGRNIREQVKAALENVGLPTSFDYDKEAAYDALTHDKKSGSKSTVTVVKCNEIGSFTFETVPTEELKALL